MYVWDGPVGLQEVHHTGIYASVLSCGPTHKRNQCQTGSNYIIYVQNLCLSTQSRMQEDQEKTQKVLNSKARGISSNKSVAEAEISLHNLMTRLRDYSALRNIPETPSGDYLRVFLLGRPYTLTLARSRMCVKTIGILKKALSWLLTLFVKLVEACLFENLIKKAALSQLSVRLYRELMRPMV